MSAESPGRILRRKAVLELTGLSRSTLYRTGARTFPRQLRISERCVGWREWEIDRWAKDPGSESPFES